MKRLVRLKRSSVRIISYIRFIIEFCSPGARDHVTLAPPMIGWCHGLRMVAQLSLLVVVISVTPWMATGFGRPWLFAPCCCWRIERMEVMRSSTSVSRKVMMQW